MEQDNFIRALGPSLMSQVKLINPDAKRLNLRQVLDYQAFEQVGQSIPRDELPEALGADYPEKVKSSEPIINVDPEWQGKYVAIIGAGAAGLCAGYELFRAGLTPVFFESQSESDGVRPGGRAYSYDFADSLGLTQKSTGDLGCMRYPSSHTTLHAYVDTVFKGEYFYNGQPTTQWPTFIDPLLYRQSGDIPQKDWTVEYDTVIMSRGVRNRQPYRINSNTTFGDIDPAIQDVSVAFGELLFGSTGILNNVVEAYAAGDVDTINSEWNKLIDLYQDKSIFEVLRDQGWDKVYPGTDNTSRLALFGELGIGSGGFDAFWGTTFMEILRIKLHEDESDQSAFLGGSSYMLKPFLTHRVGNKLHPNTNVKEITDGHVVASPVISITSVDDGGVMLSTGDGRSYKFPIVILTASPTAISSSISIDDLSIIDDTVFDGIQRLPLTGSGKIMVAFPEPFWRDGSSHFNNDRIVTTVTDYAIRQIYTFDDYHWGSGSPAGVLMMSYTWGDWSHKMGSLSEIEQVFSAMRMMKSIYQSAWNPTWDELIAQAVGRSSFRCINWSHEQGFAGGYRMADLNRYPEQTKMWINNFFPKRNDAALLLAGEATAWLGLSGWVEGALHTGINATIGVGQWFGYYAKTFSNWENMTDGSQIQGRSFVVPTDPGTTPFYPPSERS